MASAFGLGLSWTSFSSSACSKQADVRVARSSALVADAFLGVSARARFVREARRNLAQGLTLQWKLWMLELESEEAFFNLCRSVSD